MTGDELFELMRTRRAIRKFRSGNVPEADVRAVLEAGRWAPSPANLQPARFIWVRDRAIKEDLQALAKESKELSSYWDPIFAPGGSSALVNDLLTPEVIANLFNIVLIMAAVVFVVVEGLIVFSAFRFRRRAQDASEPRQVHGNTKAEIAWTILPAMIVVTLFVLALHLAFKCRRYIFRFRQFRRRKRNR